MHNIVSIPTIFLLFFTFIIIYFLIGIVKNKGIAGVIFGAKIKETIGTIKLESKGMLKTILKVHTFDKKGEKKIGIELTSTSFLSFNTIPISLNTEECRQLIELLNNAKNL